MEGTKTNNHVTPSKGFFNLRERFACSNGSSEHFPNIRTPPSRLGKIKNPFDSLIYDKLHTHFSSPTVFTPRTPKTDVGFTWTIDDISNLKPAVIDEETIEQYESCEHDASFESYAQSKIDKFFSMHEIVPSPFSQVKSSVRLVKDSASPATVTKPSTLDNSAQTILSLPPQLPKHIEEVLKPYFSYTCNQQHGEAVEGSCLYKKLFEFDEHNSSIDSSPAKSINFLLSPVRPFEQDENLLIQRSSDPHLDEDELKDCALSPVIGGKLSFSSNKSALRLKFSSQMSIDTSFDVPDIIKEHKSIMIDESMNELTVNVDFDDTTSVSDEMDVSTSNTPKSRAFSNHQRKKLSDSFNTEDQDGDDNYSKIKSNFNDFDSGYQGTMVEESWSITNIIASTPTKRNL